MNTDETMRLITLHATNGNHKYGTLLGADDTLARLARMMEKIRTAHKDEDRTSHLTAYTRRVAQLGGICLNWLQTSVAAYDDLALTVPKLADMATQDPAADPQDVKP